jgi:hypothetical protein
LPEDDVEGSLGSLGDLERNLPDLPDLAAEGERGNPRMCAAQVSDEHVTTLIADPQQPWLAPAAGVADASLVHDSGLDQALHVQGHGGRRDPERAGQVGTRRRDACGDEPDDPRRQWPAVAGVRGGGVLGSHVGESSFDVELSSMAPS